MEQDSHCDNLNDQIREAYGRVIYSQTTQVKESILYKEKESRLKWATVIASVITTCGVLGFFISSNEYCILFSVFTSMTTLVISSVLKSVDYQSLAQKHKIAADQLWVLREKYKSLLVDFNVLNIDDIVSRRDELMEISAKIYADAPTTSKKAYNLAQKALKNEEEQYFSDEELNMLLPRELRK